MESLDRPDYDGHTRRGDRSLHAAPIIQTTRPATTEALMGRTIDPDAELGEIEALRDAGARNLRRYSARIDLDSAKWIVETLQGQPSGQISEVIADIIRKYIEAESHGVVTTLHKDTSTLLRATAEHLQRSPHDLAKQIITEHLPAYALAAASLQAKRSEAESVLVPRKKK